MIAHLTLYPATYRLPVREIWMFKGREEHWNYEFLVWVLVANPAPWNHLGKKWVRYAG